jgi:ribosome biogenesis GTPase / thiamine phosphate phosphatase
MILEYLGYNNRLEQIRIEQKIRRLDVGRVIAEHKERYIVKTDQGEFEAEITGNMRFEARGRENFPAVGDWVSLTTYDGDFAIIHSIFPRSSIIQRQAGGQYGAVQIIAANIDFAFLVQATDRDFNINRLERYLAICYDSGINPIIVLTKTDLADELRIKEITDSINARIKNVPVIAVSNKTLQGYEAINNCIEKGKTYCLLGSSGAGKSTLLNNLSGKSIMKTGTISESTGKGKHITSHRELIVLANGGILIDTPGMRAVGIADAAAGLEITFDTIFQLAQRCRFKDCTHIHETGCAVLEAVENGTINKASYENYLKMEREKSHFEATVADRRKKDKDFGKMVKNYKKDIRKNQ